MKSKETNWLGFLTGKVNKIKKYNEAGRNKFFVSFGSTFSFCKEKVEEGWGL